jgi:hypothetical protein
VSRPVPTPEALREHVDRLLGEPASPRVDRSPDGAWACVAPEAGTVSVHRVAAATERGWPLPELVADTAMWAPTGTVLAGYGERDGVLFPCVARPGDRSVRTFDVPAGPLPMRWLDRNRLVVPVPVTEPSTPPVRAPAVFEADLFSRVRVRPANVPPPRRYTLCILDIRSGATVTVDLPVASYRTLNACPCGGHLVAGTDDAFVLADLRTSASRSLDTPANLAGLGWLRHGVTEFLVTAVSIQDGTEIRARTPDGSGDRVVGVVPGAPLYHSFEPPGPCLLLGDPGTGCSVVADPRPAAGARRRRAGRRVRGTAAGGGRRDAPNPVPGAAAE